MKSQKTDDFLKGALNKMFQMVGFEGFDAEFVKQDNWFSKRTWSEQDRETFRNWFLAEAKTKMKWGKNSAEKEYSYFDLMWGWSTPNNNVTEKE